MKSLVCRAVMAVVTIVLMLHVGLPSASTQTRSTVSTDKAQGSFDGFAAVVARTVTAVVNITSPPPIGFSDGLIEPPEQTDQERACLGSGVIVTPDGHILTSYHVVEHASDIRVVLSDNRELSAQIVGTDPKTDIAVLKVAAVGLPVLTLGDSSSMHAGDLTLAIGDPFGLRQTVTMGIISATGRRGLGLLHYEDFVQTDAAINPGSSGGALINVRGELIGIITGGRKDFAGVGLAVPIDIVHSVMDEILAHGRVIRGWLGVTMQSLTPATAKAFGVTEELRGALVAAVTLGGPANRAGILAGDIIIEADGKPLRDARDLDFMIGTKTPGTSIRLRAYRERRETEFTVNLTEEPTTDHRAEREPGFHFKGPLGLSVQTVTADLSQTFDLPRETQGVIVTAVEPASRAAAAALKEGDVIVEINRSAIRNAEDFYTRLRTTTTRPVLLLIDRSGTRLFVVVE